MKLNHSVNKGGFSLVEMIITAALIALVFGGLFAAVDSMIKVISNSKAKAGATTLLTDRMEFIRSLSFDAVGTIGAPPYGSIPQNRVVTLNDIQYYETVLIRNIDDPADGLGYGTDANGVINDYKQVEIEYSWLNQGATSTVSLVSNIVPVGIETDGGGGSLRVNVFDAAVQPIFDAQVTVTNFTLATTTNTTQNTNVKGELLISGLPAGGSYEISVTKAGYSYDGTYVATTSNPNPATPPVAIATSAVSTMNFQIDQTSDFLIITEGIPVFQTFSDSFTDDTLVDNYASTTRVGGSVELADAGGYYDLAGTVLSTTTAPSTIDRWYSLDFLASTSASTSVLVYLYYDTGSGFSPIPDTDLPGNGVGFAGSPIDIQSLDVSTYGTIALYGELSTTDTAFTPQLHQWGVTYVESQPTVSGASVSVTGSKVIGTDASSSPIYKFNNTYTTDGSGEVSLTNIEYDVYDVAISGGTYDILEVCPTLPHNLFPNVSDSIKFTVANLSGSFLRLLTINPSGSAVSGATVRLQNSGYDKTQTTNLCGQTYFNGSGLYDDDGYTMTISASGFDTQVLGSTTVSNTSSSTITLTPS